MGSVASTSIVSHFPSVLRCVPNLSRRSKFTLLACAVIGLVGYVIAKAMQAPKLPKVDPKLSILKSRGPTPVFDSEAAAQAFQNELLKPTTPCKITLTNPDQEVGPYTIELKGETRI